jgi:putative toxin-antitoxin system antitoxin component (TIGR02293 family)
LDCPGRRRLFLAQSVRFLSIGKWRIIDGQMAKTAAAALHEATETTKDLDRFRQQLRAGQPGPHAYVVLLGLDTFDAPGLLKTIQRGIPFRAFERFQRNTSLSIDRLIDLINIPRRTLTRRKADGRFLSDESDRLLRAARLFGKALQLFEGDRDAAVEWLTTAQPALGGGVPLDLARTELGAQEVERLAGRLEHGVFS